MAKAHNLPPNSVRGAIRLFIEQHAGELGDNVLEVGTRQHAAAAWWTSNRDLAVKDWLGIDAQDGPGVDVVADIQQLPAEWNKRFTGVVCSEVLEHVRSPQDALCELHRVMQYNAVALFTTLTAFPLHAYPNDYRRWTEEGLRAELEMAGFVDIETFRAGSVTFNLNDHGEAGFTRLTCPVHVFAKAYRA